MDSQYVLMKLVAPIMGFVLANAMFFSGVPAMLRCKRLGSLGDMNPLPFPVVLANCVSWIIYSILIEDYFLFFSNAPGAMVGMYFTLVAYGLSPYKSATRDALEAWLMILMSAMLALTLHVGIVAEGEAAHRECACNNVLTASYLYTTASLRRSPHRLKAPPRVSNPSRNLSRE